jgi:hypothetical protein
MKLKSKLASASSIEEKILYLQDSYKGRDCYILTCGPSLNEYSKKELDDLLADELVLSVKQAYNRHPEISDFHFFNCCNLPVREDKFVHYDYKDSDTISITSSNYSPALRWSPYQEHDIFLKVPIRTEKNNEFICRTKNFDKFLLSNGPQRPSGPGIMLETVIYTAVHLGVKNIYALGWDLSAKNITKVDEYNHFFGSTLDLLNRGDMLDWEIGETRSASKELYYWLKSKGISLHLVSSQSSLYENIPRARLEDIRQ